MTSFSMDTAWNRKKRTYKTLLEDNPHMTLFPFIVSTKGTFHPRTLALLQQIQRETLSPFLASEILSLSLFEMFKGIFTAYQLLQTKGYLNKDVHTTKTNQTQDESGSKTEIENTSQQKGKGGEALQTSRHQANDDEEAHEVVDQETQSNENENENERKKEEPSAKKTRVEQNTTSESDNTDKEKRGNSTNTSTDMEGNFKNCFSENQSSEISRDQCTTTDFVERDPSNRAPVWNERLPVR